ncbi:MAG TPA: MerR family transcriptional regulator [Flavipsychrobacter sp.]|nr:MerR family transcriptional regulator [Flavipsychrobacter sp.]
MRQLSLFGDVIELEPGVKKPRVKKSVSSQAGTNRSVAHHTTCHILDGWTPEKQYYTIGEVAGLFNINTSHIRFWTNEFKLKVRTTKKGDRLYNAEDIYELRSIYHLVKERGYTLAGAKSKLKEEKKSYAKTLNLKESLIKLRKQLDAIRMQL